MTSTSFFIKDFVPVMVWPIGYTSQFNHSGISTIFSPPVYFEYKSTVAISGTKMISSDHFEKI